jgi:hypothetical protein
MFKSKNTFYCFSPPVMIATCIIEFGLLFYTFYRYKMSAITRVAMASLALLGLFQMSEFAVCGTDANTVATWSRIGFMSITLLPPLGIHLISLISKRVPMWTVLSAYATGIGFALVFGFHEAAFQSHVCAGNYAIFQLMPNLGGMYFVYYYAWLVVGIIMSMYFSIDASPRIRKALVFQALGHLSFLIPTGIVNAIHPETINGIPSIMCGFAVIYALTLAFGIVPIVLAERKPKKTQKKPTGKKRTRA